MRSSIALVLLLMLAPPAHADEHGAAAKPAEAPEPYDSARLGQIRLSASTHVDETQRLFKQGMALCYAFNHDEAVRSFQRALDHDPKCALAHWGVALASGPNVNMPMDNDHETAALKEIRAAQAADAGATALERELIDALATRYAEPVGQARGARDTAYAEAMRALAKRHPDDPDVLALTAESLLDLSPWHWFTVYGQPVGAIDEAIAMLEHGLAIDTTNTGLNHLYIHSVEESLHPERGLASAARLGRLAPDAGHLVHMPTHLWARIGRYHDSAVRNVQAARIDSAYVARYQVDGIYPLMYMSHNQDFAGISYFMEGDCAAALAFSRPMAERIAAVATQVPMVDAFVARPMMILVGFRRWDEILATPEPAATIPVTHALWRFARGMAYSGKGRTAEAQVELDSLKAAATALPASAVIGFNDPKDFFAVATGMLTGDLARARQDLTAAERELRESAKRYDALAYDEPADWVLSPHLDLGATLLAKHDYKAAEAEFRTDLTQHPHHGRALFGLALALDGQGRKADATKTRAEFATAWKHADTKLSATDL